MKLKHKLFAGYCAVIVLALILCLLALNGYRTVHTHFAAVTQDILPGQQAMVDAKLSALAMVVESGDYLRTGDEIHARYAQESMDELQESLRIHREHETHLGEEEKGVAEEMEHRGLDLIELCNDLIDSYQRGAGEKELSEGRENIRLSQDELFDLLDAHLLVHEQELTEAQNAIYQTIVTGFRVFAATNVLIWVLGWVIARYSAKSILEPIRKLETGAGIIGGGDLDHRLDIKTGDEIEQLAVAFNGMAERLADMVDNLEQRVAERTRDLRASEGRFRDVAESSADWIWEVDAAGCYTYCSESVVDTLGYTPKEILGKTPFELMPPEEATRVSQVFAGIAADKRPIVDLENRNLTQDGREVVLLTSGVPILDSEGNLLGYRGVDKDITARKRAEEQERKIAELGRLHSEISDAFLKEHRELVTAARLMLKKIGEFMDISHTRTCHYSKDRGHIDMMYEWRATGIPQVNTEWQRIPAEAFSHWNKRLVTSQHVNASDLETLPKSEREFLRRRGIKSILSVPIFVEDRLFGFINLEETRRYREWHPEEISFMQATANTYASAVEHKRADDRLYEAEQRLKAKLDYLTSPAKEIGDFKLTDIIDIEILQQIQDAFAQVNGVASVIEDPDGNPITAESNYCQVCNLIRRTVKGRKSCRDSGIMLSNQVGETLQPALHPCQSLGFLEACVPIIVGGKCVANWFIGQCNTMDVTRKGIEDYGREIGADVDAMLKAFDKMPQMQMKKFEQLLSLLWQIAQDLSAFAYNNLKLAREITERKAVEEALRKSEEKYRMLIENSAIAYGILQDGKVRYGNKAAVELSGYSLEEMLSNDFNFIEDFFPPEAREKVLEHLTRRAKGERVPEYELPMWDKNHDALNVIVQNRAIEYEGRPAFEIQLVDITARKKAKEQLQRYAAELERANEEIKQFAYIVSHDLRAPLVNLKGFSAELRLALGVIAPAMDAALPHMDEEQRQAVALALQEDVPEALDFIDSSATRMDRFIQALLKLSRLGRRELDFEPIDVNTLVQATLQTLAHQIERRQVNVTMGRLPEIVADRTSMEQIVSNLLNNAIIYLDPDRPGEIEVTAESSPNETTFHVRDNGHGISEADMDKVFAPFRRAGRQDVPGEGMGLPYMQALVRRHGGRIWVESQPGKGSTFHFTIPRTPYPQP